MWGVIAAALAAYIKLGAPGDWGREGTTAVFEHPSSTQIFTVLVLLVVSFRAASAYARFWEGRSQLQVMSASLAQVGSLAIALDENAKGLEDYDEWKADFVHLVSLYHALATQCLRCDTNLRNLAAHQSYVSKADRKSDAWEGAQGGGRAGGLQRTYSREELFDAQGAERERRRRRPGEAAPEEEPADEAEGDTLTEMNQLPSSARTSELPQRRSEVRRRSVDEIGLGEMDMMAILAQEGGASDEDSADEGCARTHRHVFSGAPWLGLQGVRCVDGGRVRAQDTGTAAAPTKERRWDHPAPALRDDGGAAYETGAAALQRDPALTNAGTGGC